MCYVRSTILPKKTVKKSLKGKKLKVQYRDTHTETHVSLYLDRDGMIQTYNTDWEIYPNMHSATHRKFSTKQESSAYETHMIEYAREYGHFLRVSRSNKNIPNAYDDLPSSVFDVKDCWKHNSSRRTQYYK